MTNGGCFLAADLLDGSNGEALTFLSERTLLRRGGCAEASLGGAKGEYGERDKVGWLSSIADRVYTPWVGMELGNSLAGCLLLFLGPNIVNHYVSAFNKNTSDL